MRKIFVKREYSRRVLLPFEKSSYDRIPLKQPVTVQRSILGQKVSRVKMLQNPYFTQLLKDRYKVYTDALNKGMTVKEYEQAVKTWYTFHGYVDSGNVPSPWVALREYERDWKLKHPDDEWRTPEYLGKKKSHHGSGTWSKEKERRKKAEWRKTPVGKKSIERSKQKAKLARMNRVGK
jgi:hypothetical protein